MIIPEVTSKPIDRVAIGQERKFSIKASAKAFRLLSSTIYPDPIAAPIRELATNAADSHKDAGVKEPFLVHLPNTFEPYFSIRDYGTGISDEDIDKVYCTYFESTRTASNNFTGGFGLGSKTPFCYSDTFTVISYYAGRKMIFTAFLEDGEPKIAKFADEETTERNGLEVSFPVKKDDIYAFVSTAKKIYSRFVDKPKVVGAAGFSLTDTKYILTGDGWGIRDNGNSSAVNRYANEVSHVIMGNISYPIDSSKIGYNKETVRSLLSCGVEVIFEVGELQPTVSREHLQYDQESIKKIDSRLEEICSELIVIFEKDLAAAPTLFEARLLYGKMFGHESPYSWQLKTVFKSTKAIYKGTVIEDRIDVHSVVVGHYRQIKSPNPAPYFYTEYTLRSGRFGKMSLKKYRDSNMYAKKDTHFFVNDLPKTYEGRIRQYLVTNPTHSFYCIDNSIYADKVLLKAIFDLIGIDTSVIKTTSSLPKVPSKTRGPVAPKQVIQNMLVYTPSSSRRTSWHWKTEMIDTGTTDTVYYVDVTGHSIDLIPSMDVMVKLYDAVNSIEKKVVKVVGLRRTSKKLKKLPNWIEYVDYAKNLVLGHIATNNLSQIIANSIEYKQYMNSNDIESSIKSTELMVGTVARSFAEKVEVLASDAAKMEKMGWVSGINALSGIGIELTTSTPTHKLIQDRVELLKSYPLLPYVIPSRETWRLTNFFGWRPAVVSYLNSVKKV